MMAVDVKAGETFQAGIPRPLFDIKSPTATRFAVTRDGQRFLIPTLMGGNSGSPATVVITRSKGRQHRLDSLCYNFTCLPHMTVKS